MIAPSMSFVLIVSLLAGQAQSSAVKGHSSQQQQRAVEQAPVKSAAGQQPFAERQPKAAAPAQPILESSKKVYNDESLRRSAVGQQQVAGEPAAKSAAAPLALAPVPVAGEPVAVAPVVQSAPVVAPAPVPVVVVAAPAAVKPVEPSPVVVAAAQAPAPAELGAIEPKKADQVEPKSGAIGASEQAKPVEQPAKPGEAAALKAEKDELPAQSVRSAPIKDEPQPVSRVIVEHQVAAKPAGEQQAPVVVPVAAVVMPAPVAPVEQPAQPVQAVPVEVAAVAEPKPAIVQPADSPLQAKKDEQQQQPAKEAEPAPIEVPAPDPGLVLSEPIDSTTKLLIDLDEHVQKFLPAEDKQEPGVPAKDQALVSGVDYSPASSADQQQQPSGKSSAPLVPYSSSVSEPEPIVPPLPQSIDKVEKASGAVPVGTQAAAAAPVQSNTRQASSSSSSSSSSSHQNQQQVITQLLDQLDSLQNRIQDTMNQLVARRRYVMSALLRPMGTYVRRVRTNLERLQNRVNQLQAAAVSVGGNQNGQRPGGFVDAAAIETIRRRIDDISKRISDIVNRIRFSLTPTSAPLNNGK